MAQLVMDWKTGQLVGYVGRDKKFYPIVENAICCFHDAPGDEYEFTVIWVQNGIIKHRAHTDQTFIDEYQKEGEIIRIEPDGVSHRIH